MKRLVDETTERNPDRKDLLKGAQPIIEDYLADESFAETPIPTLFETICKEAGIEISVKTLSDEMLDLVCPGPWPEPRPPKPRPSFLVDIPFKDPIPP